MHAARPLPHLACRSGPGETRSRCGKAQSFCGIGQRPGTHRSASDKSPSPCGTQPLTRHLPRQPEHVAEVKVQVGQVVPEVQNTWVLVHQFLLDRQCGAELGLGLCRPVCCPERQCRARKGRRAVNSRARNQSRPRGPMPVPPGRPVPACSAAGASVGRFPSGAAAGAIWVRLRLPVRPVRGVSEPATPASSDSGTAVCQNRLAGTFRSSRANTRLPSGCGRRRRDCRVAPGSAASASRHPGPPGVPPARPRCGPPSRSARPARSSSRPAPAARPGPSRCRAGHRSLP